MASQTEAACLLETGALYTKRIMLRSAQGDPIFAGVKQGVFSLYYGDAPIYHFDLEGRWQRAFVDGIHYLKGFDTTIQAIDRVRIGENMVLKRRTLRFAEAADLDASIRSAALDLFEALGTDRLERVAPPTKALPLSDGEVRAFLESISAWDSARWFAHREKYLGTYGPLPILPPDCQHAVVLQATLGHVNGLAFGLAKGAEHYVRSPSEFAEHATTVSAMLGRRIEQCKTVFLGGADVLLLPEPDVLAYLEIVARVLPLDPIPVESARSPRENPTRLNGIHAFLDQFSAPAHNVDAWKRFGQAGLKRVSLGVESGDPEVRAMYGKSWTNDELRATVTDLKEAGIGVGVLVLVGAGGAESSSRHLESTAALIDSLPLGTGGLVSLLDANELADAVSLEGTTVARFTPLTGSAWSEQQAEIRKRLSPFRARTGAKVAPYSLEKQGGA